MRHPNATRRWPALLAACLVTVVLAGCTGPFGDDNRPPVARLVAQPDPAWMGEQVTFDLAQSYDPDGRVVHYLLDLGDGTTRELDQDDELHVTHAYSRGGVFEVSLTVTDDGEDDAGEAASDKDRIEVRVHDREPVDVQVLRAGNLTGNVSDQADTPFVVAPQATGFELALNATNVLSLGGSEIRVAVLDPVGDVLAQRTLALGPGATIPLDLEGDLLQGGTHVVRVTANQGGATVQGEVRILYG